MRHTLLSLMLFVFVGMACSSEQDLPADQNDASITAGDGSHTHGDISDNQKDSTVSQKDVYVLPGTFGAPCTQNDDCDSAICIDTANGKVCSKTCTEDCPLGFECVEKTGGTDSVFYCRSRFVTICDPCFDSTDCNIDGGSENICISQGNSGSFCGVKCEVGSNDCLAGYECKPTKDDKSGTSSHQCVPKNGGECLCSLRARKLTRKTACAIGNEFGTCLGQRTCGSSGLSTCSAKKPQAEECNLKDDNCDGNVDNITKGQVACTVKNQHGTCAGTVDKCDTLGDPVCSAKSPKPELCNGIDDDCDSITDENLCDDGNSCTTDSCNTDGSCKHQDLTNVSCDDGDVCTKQDKCATGTCVGSDKKVCNDDNPCTQDLCDKKNGCTFKPLSKGSCADDGNPCTQDLCKVGTCSHPQMKNGLACSSDGEVCTTDQCKAGICAHLANTKKCDDGDKCTLNDYCKDTKCLGGKPKDCNDGNPCTNDLCKKDIGCYHKPALSGDGAPCIEDGNPCTNDVCKGAQCVHLPVPGCS